MQADKPVEWLLKIFLKKSTKKSQRNKTKHKLKNKMLKTTKPNKPQLKLCFIKTELKMSHFSCMNSSIQENGKTNYFTS